MVDLWALLALANASWGILRILPAAWAGALSNVLSPDCPIRVTRQSWSSALASFPPAGAHGIFVLDGDSATILDPFRWKQYRRWDNARG